MRIKYFSLMLPMLSLMIFIALGGRAVAQSLSTLDLAERSYLKGSSCVDFGTYQGILLIHGMAELAEVKKDPQFTKEVESIILKFKTGEIDGTKGNFISYNVGGTGAAYMDYKRMSPYFGNMIKQTAEKMLIDQTRSCEGLMVWNQPEAVRANDKIFIDMAFAVTPFLLYTGLKNNNQEYIDYAVYMTLKLFEILRDKSNGLLHQGRGFQGKGVISQDNWSRGNGWGALSLATLVRDLPDSHPQKETVNSLAKEYFNDILKFQDSEGMFHQEMTAPKSFVETSGTGLLLYSIGIGIEKGLLPTKYMENVKLGLRGLTSYIHKDGSINNTSLGCLCPKDGTKEDYINHTYIYNEPHAFGAIVLAMVQGYRLGIKEITPLKKLGIYAQQIPYEQVPPQTVFKYLPQYKRTVAWENDKIAFRIFNTITNLGSGIDIFAKKVTYPIIEKFYEQNRNGLSYHEDHGEGLDFYNANLSRGCGGIAVFQEGKRYTSAAYYKHDVLKNNNEEIEFELIFKPFKVGNKTYTERKTIRMKMGTQFFEVTSVLNGEPGDIVVGIGLTVFGDVDIRQANKEATLSIWDKMNENPYALGTAVLADKAKFTGFKRFGSDEYVLMKVSVGQPFTYKVGAAWEGAGEVKTADEWYKMVSNQLKKVY